MTLSKQDRFRIRKERVSRKVFGTGERPRISVFKSNRNIYVQVIDDLKNRTIASASNLSSEIKGQAKGKSKTEQSKLVGELLGKKAVSAGVSQAVFDKGGYKYQGRIKSLADAAREAGLKF